MIELVVTNVFQSVITSLLLYLALNVGAIAGITIGTINIFFIIIVILIIMVIYIHIKVSIIQ